MENQLISSFPTGFTPTERQVYLLAEIDAAFKSGKKFVICCAPTGSGKSFISKTLGNSSRAPSQKIVDLVTSYKAYKQEQGGDYLYSEEYLSEPTFGSYALTITRALQDQYVDLFEDTSSLKGKSNYQCEVDPNVDVETAPCVLTPSLRDECWSKNLCPYYNARNSAVLNKFSTLNYKMFLSLPEHIKQRQYIICDEASELEDEFVKHFSVFIDPDKLAKLGLTVPLLYSTDSAKMFEWLNATTATVADYVADLLEEWRSNKSGKIKMHDKRKLNYFTSLKASLTLIQKTWATCEYICQREGKTVKLTPLRVNTLTSYVFGHADRVLLMSATIVDHKNFAKTLGITDYKYIEVDSVFDSAKAPIHISRSYKLNRANLDKCLPLIAKQIKEICDSHGKDKGIIHTHTLQITKFLQGRLQGERYLFRDSEYNNQDILDEHMCSPKSTVLVSPSMTFGVDLKDDLARFQIIVKAGYLPLNDNRIKRLFEEDPDWYTDRMLINLVQACGRGIRSKDDHCVTYILDGGIYDAILRNKNKLPKYFLDRFV